MRRLPPMPVADVDMTAQVWLIKIHDWMRECEKVFQEWESRMAILETAPQVASNPSDSDCATTRHDAPSAFGSPYHF